MIGPPRPRRAWLAPLSRAIWFLRYQRGWIWMSHLRRWWVLLNHLHADVQIDRSAYLGPGFSLHIPHGGHFHVGPRVQFRRNFRAEISGDGRITIGAGSFFTYDVLMLCSTSIDVGERVGLAQSTAVIDGTHRFRGLDKPMLSQGFDFKPITLADDVSITTKCTIVANVGTRAFIGANSVVTKDIPAYTLAVGAPARPIDYFGPPGTEPPPGLLSAGGPPPDSAA